VESSFQTVKVTLSTESNFPGLCPLGPLETSVFYFEDTPYCPLVEKEMTKNLVAGD